MLDNEPIQTTVQQSPWKKPKPVISLSKTKSLKRKSEIFAIPSNNSTEFSNFDPCSTTTTTLIVHSNDCEEPSSKTRKTFLNKFSVRNESFSVNLSNSQLNDAINSMSEVNFFVKKINLIF